METFNELLNLARPVFETIYFLSGVVVSGCAIYALKQVALLKKSISIQSKRDALKLTAEQCNDYMQVIIPLQNKLNNSIEKNGVTFFEGWTVDITKENCSVTHQGTPNTHGLENISCSNVLNAMETFSTYFVSGVADDTVAYHTVGTTFLHSVNKLMPVLINYRESGYYKNVTTLFIRWRCRRNEEDLIKEKEIIEQKLKSNKVSIPLPLGEKVT
ncbi:hypothetical protein [Shewanella baltica]|uniref:hypothetical protein n=1 Tax=Shewanella baltica TaxID=62322 RepID=UPI003218C513